MENRFTELIKKVESENSWEIGRLNHNGDLFEEFKQEVTLKFKKQKINESIKDICSFLSTQTQGYIDEGDMLKAEGKHLAAIRSYFKAYFTFIILEDNDNQHVMIVQSIIIALCKVSHCYNSLKIEENEYYIKDKSCFYSYDPDYGAIINAAFILESIVDKLSVESFDECMQAISSVDFDYTCAIKVAAIMMVSRYLSTNDARANRLIEKNNYTFIKDNMYLGYTYDRVKEASITYLANRLVEKNEFYFVAKILEKNPLIKDCYQKILSIQ